MKIHSIMPGLEMPGYNDDVPLGIAYISAALKRAGHRVECPNLKQRPGPIGGLVPEAATHSAPDTKLATLLDQPDDTRRLVVVLHRDKQNA